MLIPPAHDFHLQLKSRTQAAHQALHHNAMLSRLMRRDCTREEYRAILHRFFMFYTQNEARFNGLGHLKFHAEAPVLTWLQQDLAVLGDALHSPGDTPQSLGDTPHSPGDHPDAHTLADFSQYVGYLYVKQGSTLGGQVLCRHLQTSIGLSPNNGLRFFYGYGERTRQHWLDVLRYFEDRKAEVNISTAVTSACNHFRQLQIMFEKAETVAI